MANKQAAVLKKLIRRLESTLKATEAHHAKMVGSIETSLDEAEAALQEGDTASAGDAAPARVAKAKPVAKVAKSSKSKPIAKVAKSSKSKPVAKVAKAKVTTKSSPVKKSLKKKKVRETPVEES